MRTLDDKVAVVTGASRGIGRAIAERLGRDGVEVVVNYAQNAGKAQRVAEASRRRGAGPSPSGPTWGGWRTSGGSSRLPKTVSGRGRGDQQRFRQRL